MARLRIHRAALSMTPADSVDSAEPDPIARVDALKAVIIPLITAAEPLLDPAMTNWRTWFYVYLLWHESAQLTTRVQRADGPGRGLMQFEPSTAWGTIKYYVLGATPGLVARLARGAQVDAASVMLPTLRKFANLLDPGETWPAAVPEIERWLVQRDGFAFTLLQIALERFRVSLPPFLPILSTVDPRDPLVQPQFAEVWADCWWKGPAAQRPLRIQQFLASARALQAALP